MKYHLRVLSLLIVYVGIGAYFIWKMPTDLEPLFAHNYLVDLVAYFIMAGLSTLVLIARRLDLFEPLVLVSVVYISIFTVAPMHDLIIGNYYFFGVNLFSYGIKGTIIAVIGFVMFCAGYSRRDLIAQRAKPQHHAMPPQYNSGKILQVTSCVWAASFAMGLINAISGGKSITYVLTLGIIGASNTALTIDAPIGFAGAMAMALVPTSIIYAHFGRSPFLNAVVQILSLTLLASQGFRYIVIIFVLAHFYVWHIKKERAPRMGTLIALLCLLVIFVGVMGFYRTALRTGIDADWSLFGLNEVTQAVFGNLEIYKTYYGVIHAVPDLVPYGMGRQMFVYTAILMVPRVLWPSKPLPPVHDPIREGVSDYAAVAGAAYPNIGEYYFEFGVFGVLAFMYLLGELLDFVRRRYRTSRDILDVVLYSIVVVGMFQVVIRGYTPSNFYMLALMIVPVSIVKRLATRVRYPGGDHSPVSPSDQPRSA